MTTALSEQIAATAARLVVEEGLDYGPAKRRAAQALGINARASTLPDNQQVEDEVRDYLALFCAETQPAELAALRLVALEWMQRLAAFRPHLTGAVWRGTATRLNSVHLQLYCDDSKEAELGLINLGVDYDVGSTAGPRGELVDVLTVSSRSRELGEHVTVHLTVLDHDDLRGALKPDAGGRTQRGDLSALRRLMEPAFRRRHEGANMNRRRWLVGGVAAAAGAAGIAGAWRRAERSAGGSNAPPSTSSAASADIWSLRFEQPAGGELVLANLKGKPLLLNFWATWCPPCVTEMPLLDRFQAQQRERGWQVVGLAVDGPTPVREFLVRQPMSFSIGLAGLDGLDLVRALGNASGALPFSVVFDRAGKAVHTKLGALSEKDLADWLGSVA